MKFNLEKVKINRKKEIVKVDILKNGFIKIKYVGYRIKRNSFGDGKGKEVFIYWRRGYWRN